jgi:hypothetical protein
LENDQGAMACICVVIQANYSSIDNKQSIKKWIFIKSNKLAELKQLSTCKVTVPIANSKPSHRTREA